MRQFGFFIGALLMFFFQVDSAPAKISYVKVGVSGDGSSWINASGDLQAVINESSDGDEIWVAAGIYIPNRQLNNPGVITSGNRNNAFVISKNIRIYGGFAGYETGISERSVTENTTVLSRDTGYGNPFRYKGFYEYLSGAKPKCIVENWNSTVGIIIYEDAQRGATDKILSVDGDVTIGMTSSVDIDVHASSQCLLEVSGNLHIRPGGYLWLGGYKYDPTIPGIEASKYPVLLMKGGTNSSILFDRPVELIIKSQNKQQEWMRSIGFVSDGTIKFIAHQLSLAERMSESETTYKAEDNGLVTVEAVVKGGLDGVTQSLAYQTENGALIDGGNLKKESVDLKNITHFHLVSEREQLQFESEEYENRNEIIHEPDQYAPASGNIDRNVDPLFQNISTADFKLKPESPLIDAGDNQKYFEVAGLIQEKGNITGLVYNVNISDLMQKGETDIAGNIVIWSQQGKLYIHTEKPERINIYTLSGILIRVLNLQENETATIGLDMGIYIVVPSGGKAQKIVI